MRITLQIIILLYSLAGNFRAQYAIEDAFPNLTFSNPIFLCNAGDGSNRIFVVERSGIIKVFDNSSAVQTYHVFLDIQDSVSAGGEMGLLGLVFHPDYENNGYFYVNYTTTNPMMTRISRFKVSVENPDSADKNSELIMLTFSQPFTNHNGGWIGFGPNDGYLYIATGDGGSGGDPQNNSQSLYTFLGKILRIDVDNASPGFEYSIPPDNPFIDSTGAVLKEIFAWGLRNPWRDSFDPVTGWLWTGDVGQNIYEEVDVIEKGKNYGWRCYEGNHDYNLTGCDYPEYAFPVWEYSHGPHCSVTGGYVYRGSSVPDLAGKYIYADYCSGVLWALEYDGTEASNQTLLTVPALVVSFGVDESNELYIITFSPNNIYRFTPTAQLVAPSQLIANATAPDEVLVSWADNESEEEGYNIERKTGENGNYDLLETLGPNIQTYTDQTVEANTIYYYRVYAFLDQIISEYSNEDSAKTPIATSLDDLNTPYEFNLKQNYPNPFNPITSIKYQIANDEFVNLVVFNSLGEKVAILVNENKMAGSYNVSFDANDLPSGVYVYKLTAGNFIDSKKMILLR
ncbi:MAG: PQQ-dependent sugar dehydrogenase [Ignavibacteria bacterium]|jgi:glucose/arabinose dehydrogenase